MSAPNTRPDHEVITLTPIGVANREALRQQCYDVRVTVFVHEQGFPLDVEIDEPDEYGTHFLLRLLPSLEPIGTIRTHRTPGGYYKLSRLAILESYRKYGFGRVLVNALIGWVRTDALAANASNSTASGAATAEIVLHSQIHAKKFYEKFEFVAEGAEFDEDGAPHQRMVLRMPL